MRNALARASHKYKNIKLTDKLICQELKSNCAKLRTHTHEGKEIVDVVQSTPHSRRHIRFFHKVKFQGFPVKWRCVIHITIDLRSIISLFSRITCILQFYFRSSSSLLLFHRHLLQAMRFNIHLYGCNNKKKNVESKTVRKRRTKYVFKRCIILFHWNQFINANYKQLNQCLLDAHSYTVARLLVWIIL